MLIRKGPVQGMKEKKENAILSSIEKALDKLRFGAVLITVHDSKVVQIETTEKLRFDRQDKSEYEI